MFQEVKSNQSKEVPLVLLGNKGDMVHLRQVSSEEGEKITEKTRRIIYVDVDNAINNESKGSSLGV